MSISIVQVAPTSARRACLASAAGRPIEADVAHWFAGFFGVLGDPLRLRILTLSLSNDDVSAMDCAVALGEQEHVVTPHLQSLATAGFLDGDEMDGRPVYRISELGIAFADMLRLAA